MGARPTYCEGFPPDTPSRDRTIENGAEGRKRYSHGRRRRPCPFGGVPTVVQILASRPLLGIPRRVPPR
jgi:hypothetical protein